MSLTGLERSEDRLVRLALAGDEDAFRALTEPYRRELELHCYRMLGSRHEAEDVLQETFLRAWRRLDSYSGRAPVRAWLYAIATNGCLNALKARPRRLPAYELGPAAAAPVAPLDLPASAPGVEPYPDALLRDDPATRYDLRESVSLAFLTTIQHLPPRQRAVLLLRDVLGFDARETGDFLDMSRAAVNSALQRARATLQARMPARAATPTQEERRLLDRFVDAWHRNDVRGLVALLREDAVLTMPPFPAWYEGAAAIGRFFATVPGDGDLRRVRLIPTRANGQAAVAAYLQPADETGFDPYGLMVFDIDGDRIAQITGYAGLDIADYGVPPRLR